MPRCETAMVLIVAIAVGVAPSVAAQQARRTPQAYWQDVGKITQQDNLRTVATNINAQRSEYYHKKDLAGLSTLYTEDAIYIELMPQFQLMTGRAQVQQHLREIMDASVTDNVPTVTTAEMNAKGEIVVGGSYYLVVGKNKIGGRFFQVLRNEGGAWKIAMHAFARAQPVTPNEASNYNVGG